jgi:uncharacterized protein Usg
MRLESPKSQDEAFVMQLRGYRLATAEIIYHMPDHPHLLQSFVWQQYDMAPDFPVLHRFLEFWRKNIEGAIHTVRVASVDLVKPAEIRALNGVLRLH